MPFLKRDAPPATVGSLVIPESARDWRGTQGTALAVGPKANTVKAGDRLLLPPLGGVEVVHHGELVALFPEADILGVLPRAGAES